MKYLRKYLKASQKLQRNIAIYFHLYVRIIARRMRAHLSSLPRVVKCLTLVVKDAPGNGVHPT